MKLLILSGKDDTLKAAVLKHSTNISVSIHLCMHKKYIARKLEHVLPTL